MKKERASLQAQLRPQKQSSLQPQPRGSCKDIPAHTSSPACKTAQDRLELRARDSAMEGLARRLAVQTLSQLLTFGLCASSTESFIYQPPQQRPTPAVRDKTSPADPCSSLHCYLGKSYHDLFQLSPHLEFSASEIAAEKRALEEGRTSCVGKFRARVKQYGDRLDQQQKQLKLVSAKVNDTDRHNLHCDIQNYRAQKAEAELLASHGIPTAYELEADQLGIQYAWNSSYDPMGFIRYSDKVASKVGYARGMSWFRTHPPFYERMVDGEREIMFLPKKENYAMQSPEFEQMKKALAPATAKSEQEQKDKPSLLMPEKGYPEPQKADYKPGEPIDKTCAHKAW
jgi:peptidase M48-like protein